MPLDGLIKNFDVDFIERSQVAIEDDTLAADGVDGREFGIRHGVWRA